MIKGKIANMQKRILYIPTTYRLHISGAACIGNSLIAIGKLLLGILSASPFTCMSACYSFAMVFAKACVLIGIHKEKSQKQQAEVYTVASMWLILASLIYILYAVRLFFYPSKDVYDMNLGIAIATFTFLELGLNIRGVIIERNNKSILMHAIKMINLASSCLCLALTQTALLSFTHSRVAFYDPSIANGIIGVCMGSMAALLGIGMMVRVKHINKQCV